MKLADLHSKKVLIIDDFANVRKSIKNQLQDMGIIDIREAADGDAAQNILNDTSYSLILCDYNLGRGRDGARLLEEWRLAKIIPANTVFVLITAETSRDLVVSALEYQPDDYLAKPFTGEVLANRLIHAFERRETLTPLLTALADKDWLTVREEAKKIMEEHPRHRGYAQKAYVESLLHLRELDLAEFVLQELLAKRPQSWTQTALQRINLMRNDLEGAEKGFKAILNEDPNMIDAYDFLAETLEKLNKDKEQQEWLECAVSRAPKNINRQKKLIEAAQKNLDFKAASGALRSVMKMSLGTMYEDVSVFLSYIRNLKLEDESTDDDKRKRQISREITSTVRKMNDRFSSDPNAKLYNKALVIFSLSDISSSRHDEKLNDLLTQTFSMFDEIKSETALFIADTFYKSQRYPDADELVKRFKKKFANDPEVIKQFDALQAEPISLKDRNKAKICNLKGIECYKKQDFDQSIHYFQDAMEISPRHPGIILNFIQSHLLKMKQEGVQPANVNICLESIDRLGYLTEDHHQYARLSRFKQNLQAIS